MVNAKHYGRARGDIYACFAVAPTTMAIGAIITIVHGGFQALMIFGAFPGAWLLVPLEIWRARVVVDDFGIYGKWFLWPSCIVPWDAIESWSISSFERRRRAS